MTASIGLSGRILVVDDQESNLLVVSALLARHGYEVATAANGNEALAILQSQPPDLVLLDMLMPGMDGFELMAEIRRSGALAQLPVVFLTVAHDRDLLVRAFESGAVDYVTKPFMPEELLARVEAHLGLKRMRDRLERLAHEREELMTLVAHDLKNPLTSIHFASEILLAGTLDEARRQRYLEMIRDSTADAFDYIRRYLGAQQADSERRRGRDDGTRPSACLGEVFRWLHNRYALQLEARGAQLRLPVLDNPPRVAIEALVLRCMDDMRDEPRLVVRAAEPVIQLLDQRIDQLMAQSGFGGKLVLVPDETMALTDCRIDWADGSAERKQAVLEQDVDQAVERYVAGLQAELAQLDG